MEPLINQIVAICFISISFQDVDHVTNSVQEMQTELNLTQCEVTTLKNLMAGKDMLVLQKCRALELAKVRNVFKAAVSRMLLFIS